MSSAVVCKRSSLIAIVNRLYMNANNDQVEEQQHVGGRSSKEEDNFVEAQKQRDSDSDSASREASKSPKNERITSKSNLSPPIIPLSPEIASNGISAVGGCRQCSRTFTDRLSLIHHFVDHFPTIFYSFESSSSMVPLIPKMPSATTSSALGISNVNSQIIPQKNSSSTTKNGCGQKQQHQQYASGIQSMMFFPYVSMNGNNHHHHQMQISQQHLQQQQNLQQGQEKVKEVSEATVATKKKKESKPKNNNHGSSESVKETSSRFTDFNKTSNDLPYDMCPHCCQTFSDHSIYSEHLKTHDTPVISLGSPMTSESPLKCEYCDLRFSNEYLLKEHKKIHCRICSVCSKTLMTAFDLNLHMGIHSGFSYDCKDCGRCFPDRKALALHNKMHRSDLSTQDSDDEKQSQKSATILLKENVKKPKIEKPSPSSFSGEDKPESFFKNNPYFENIFKQNPRKRRQRLHRSGTGEGTTENLKKKLKNV